MKKSTKKLLAVMMCAAMAGSALAGCSSGDSQTTAAAAEAPTCNSQLAEAIPNLSFCRFTRRYWGNPCWFLFLRLLICLSSAGIPT